MPNLLTIINVS